MWCSLGSLCRFWCTLVSNFSNVDGSLMSSSWCTGYFLLLCIWCLEVLGLLCHVLRFDVVSDWSSWHHVHILYPAVQRKCSQFLVNNSRWWVIVIQNDPIHLCQNCLYFLLQSSLTSAHTEIQEVIFEMIKPFANSFIYSSLHNFLIFLSAASLEFFWRFFMMNNVIVPCQVITDVDSKKFCLLLWFYPMSIEGNFQSAVLLVIIISCVFATLNFNLLLFMYSSTWTSFLLISALFSLTSSPIFSL